MPPANIVTPEIVVIGACYALKRLFDGEARDEVWLNQIVQSPNCDLNGKTIVKLCI